MVKRITAITVCIIAILSVLSGCAGTQRQDDGKISIVATIFPAYDFARAVAGDRADITMLLPPGADVHTFEPTPGIMTKIQHCDLFIYNGGESDEWVRTLLESDEYADLRTLRMVDYVTLLDEPETASSAPQSSDREADEHVWTSPLNAVKITMAIALELTKADGENTAYYMSNAEAYTDKLYEINDEMNDIVKSIDNPVLVFADRFPMYYFAYQYGFSYYAAFPGCSSQTEPSAATVSYLIDKVRAENISAVFCIELSNGKLADVICEETGAKKYTLHSCHNISSEDFNAGRTYYDIMKENAKTLREAFGI